MIAYAAGIAPLRTFSEAIVEQPGQVGEFTPLTALHGQQPPIPDVQVGLAEDEVARVAARKDAPQEDEEMFGELLDLRLLAP